MADLTIGAIIALANKDPRGGIDNGPDLLTCWQCDREPPTPRALGVVAAVDRERKTITVSGLPDLRGPVEPPQPLTMEQLRRWTTP